MELSARLYERIKELSSDGDIYFDDANFPVAINKWSEAIDLLPEPKSDWESYTWLCTSIGDAYFQLTDFDAAKHAFFDALNGPSGQNNPFIHYRLGQSELNLGNEKIGIEHLLRAYMLDGEKIFLGEPVGLSLLQKLKDRMINLK